MNDMLNLILQRRSIKRYKPEMVERGLIEQVIQAGLAAASGMNRQSPIVVAISDPEVRNRLAAANAAVMGADMDPFYGAPVVLVVLADKNVPTYVYDGSLVMGNMMLAAEALGLGSCWIHRAKETFDMPEWKAWLKSIGVEGDYEGIGNCILGYGDGPALKGSVRRNNRMFIC